MQKDDRRVVRTRKLLKDALAQLLQEKPLSEITVNDLVERAGVSRTSFYRNYQDKDEFVSQILDEVLGGILACGDLYLETNSYQTSTERYYCEFFQYIQRNEVFFRTMADSDRWPEFKQRFLENGIAAYQKLIGDRTLAGETPSRMLIHYIVSAHVGVISYWLQDGCRYSPQFMSQWLSHITIEGPLKLCGLDEEALRKLPK